MFGLLVLCGVCCCFMMVDSNSDMGPGQWNVDYITKCEEEDHVFKFDISQEKFNRTHDGFNAYILLEQDFTDDYGVVVDICKYGDGGCKPIQVLTDASFANFAKKFAGGNVRSALEMAKIDPPDFPIPAGEYKVDNYMLDYSELPSDAAYGEYSSVAYFMDGSVKVGCIEIHAEFREKDDE